MMMILRYSTASILALLLLMILAPLSTAAQERNSSSSSKQSEQVIEAFHANKESKSDSTFWFDSPTSSKKYNMERMTYQVRTTLDNVDIDNTLTSAEILFFEDTWKSTFQATAANDIIVRSVIVEQEERAAHRHLLLRAGFLSSSHNWRDVQAMAEFYSCNDCGPDDDDQRNRSLMGKSDLKQFENRLCDRLRDGPHDRFSSVEDCHVGFSKK